MTALKSPTFRLIVASVSTVAIVALGSASASAAPLVGSTPTTTVLSASVSTSVTGEVIRLKAVVAENPGAALPTGNVNFTDSGAPIGTGALVPVNGHAAVSLNVTLTTTGSHSLLATYVGDTVHAASSGALSQPVTAAATTVVIVASPRTAAGAYQIDAQAKVTKPGSGIPTGTATFTVDATPPTALPLGVNGHAKLNANFTVGSIHSVHVAYGGDANFTSSAGDLLNFTVVIGGGFHPLASSRILDTRHSLGFPGPVAPVGTARFTVLGAGGVPLTGVSAVLLTVTATDGSSSGFLTAFTGGGLLPSASTLNFAAGQTVPNAVVVPVASDGTVSIYNGSGGHTQMIADVSGYYDAGAATVPGAYGPLAAPFRVLDTRLGTGGTHGPIASNKTVTFTATGLGGVPATGVTSVLMNVTVTSATSDGFITAFAGGSPQPGASSLNFVHNQTVANLVSVPVGGAGTVTLFNGSNGNVQLIADVIGYVVSGSPTVTGAFGPLAPTRVLDTRSGLGGVNGPVAVHGIATFTILGAGGVPATGVSAVILNVTVTAPTGAGFITAFAGGGPQPNTSNLNFVSGQTVANLVVVPVGAGGTVSLYNGSASGTTQILADVAGYYLS